MKLDFDAVRELLLVIENEVDSIDVNKVVFNSSLESFDKNSLGYALTKLIEAKILIGSVTQVKTGTGFTRIQIESISLEGHKFLDSIRVESNWEKIKKFALEKGSASLGTLVPIALERFI